MPPASPEEPAALAYVEKTLAESYRKEIDQEENVWRSLPFFAATLALQLAALFQMIDKLPDPATLAGAFSVAFLGLAGIASLVSLLFLSASIYPQRFDYVAREPMLLAYAQALILHEEQGSGGAEPLSALVTLKTELCRQYAKGADHNRQINKRRERRRSIAGLAALASVLMTVLLVATTYSHYLYAHGEGNAGRVIHQSTPIGRPADGQGPDAGGPAGARSGAPAPAHAARHQGMVDAPR